MLKGLSAILAAAVCAGIIVGFVPQPEPAAAAATPRSAPREQSNVAINSAPVVAAASACTQTWPYYEQSCLRDSRQIGGGTDCTRHFVRLCGQSRSFKPQFPRSPNWREASDEQSLSSSLSLRSWLAVSPQRPFARRAPRVPPRRRRRSVRQPHQQGRSAGKRCREVDPGECATTVEHVGRATAGRMRAGIQPSRRAGTQAVLWSMRVVRLCAPKITPVPHEGRHP